MNRDPGPTDCCDYECVNARDCPVRCKLQTQNGGESIDTKTTLDIALERVDRVIVGVRFVLLVLSMVCVVMVVSYFFG